MKTKLHLAGLILVPVVVFLANCGQPQTENAKTVLNEAKPFFGGFESKEEWGRHLVIISGCNDCHTAKIMTDHGPDLDSTMLLAGHPAQMPAPDVDRKSFEGKGLVATNMMLTAWVGPWGISYALNLTSDPTGLGNWPEENFIRAMREGKYKGLADGRTLLPPMPWPNFRHMTDDELKAIFAFLKTTKPINNIVPEAQPPVLAAK